MKRLFVAFPVSEEVRKKIAPIADGLVKTGADLKLVSLEKAHFTLKFLGDVEEKKISEIQEKLGTIAKQCRKLNITVKGVGVFPSLERINVVWVGAEDSSLFLLMKEVNTELDYIKKNDHDTEIPHLTIARVKTGKNKEKLQEFLRSVEKKEFGKIFVDKLILYESELTKEGPIYTKLAEFGCNG